MDIGIVVARGFTSCSARKAMRANQGVALLLTLATLLMAVGRYVF
jgi:hypothetical protein